MIRVIIRITDFGDAAHVDGMKPSTKFRTIDIEAPTVESLLTGPRSEWVNREVIGVEVITEEGGS